jgi:hypothetical protein
MDRHQGRSVCQSGFVFSEKKHYFKLEVGITEIALVVEELVLGIVGMKQTRQNRSSRRKLCFTTTFCVTDSKLSGLVTNWGLRGEGTSTKLLSPCKFLTWAVKA